MSRDLTNQGPAAAGVPAAPKRIQRQRTKGWRMPEGAVYVGRPTQWGNPWQFNYASATSRRVSIAHYRRWAEAFFAADTPIVRELTASLRGHDLACWCPLDQPCHADVLLELANGPQAPAESGLPR